MSGLFGGSTIRNVDTQIGNFQINSATYGLVVPLVLGTSRISGNIIDYFDCTPISHTTREQAAGGGKGGGGVTTENTTWTYTVAALIGLAEGPGGVGRIWRDKEILSGTATAGLTMFSGEYGQSPWPYTQSTHPEKALPYSGLAYVAGVIDLGGSGSLPTYGFEYLGQLLATGDGIDVNPADAIQYIVNDLTAGGIDAASLARYRTFCKAADLLISLPLTDTQKAFEIIKSVCSATNTLGFWSQDKLKLVPRCDEVLTHGGAVYTPVTIPEYDLDENDFLENGDSLVTFEREDNSEAFNHVTVEFLNRANSYEKETAEYKIQSDINRRGLRSMDTVEMHYLHTKERAEYVASLLAMDSLYGRNQYKFRLGWSHCLLEPGDLVTIKDDCIGPNKIPVTIVSNEEDEDGQLEIVAKGKPPGIYSPGRYTAHQADRPSIDFGVDPGNVNPPVIFDAPSEITTTGLETWIAISGADSNWGGCNVWISEDGDTYKRIGTIHGPSRMGTLTAPMAIGDTALSMHLTGGDQLLSGTLQDAQNLNTLCWVDGELIAYQTATLTGPKAYSLSGLVRGAHNTTIAAHVSGGNFVRLDQALFKYPFAKEQIGKTVYLKFTSMNVYGVAEQTLADVAAVTHVIEPQLSPYVTNVYAEEHFRPQGNGAVLNDLLVTFTPPAVNKFFTCSEAYIKSNQPTGGELNVTGGQLNVPGGQIGDAVNAWTDVGSSTGENILIQNLILGQEYTVKLVSVFSTGETSDFGTSPIIKRTILGKTYTPQTPSGLTVNITDKCEWTWNPLADDDADFAELRTDQNPGQQTGMMAKTLSAKTTVTPPVRQGTVYLYAHNTADKYSSPCIFGYNKPVPVVPTNVVITDIFQGLVITCAPLPVYCLGINVHVNDGTGDKVCFGPNNSYNFKTTGGIFDIQVAYVDLFGEGMKSAVIQKTVVATVDPALIAAESLSLAMMSPVVKNAVAKANDAATQLSVDTLTGEVVANKSAIDVTISSITQTVVSNKTTQDGVNTSSATQITQNADDITLVATNLRNANTVIAQNSDAIQLRATKDNLVALINLSPETITIASKFNHVAGDTLFDDNVIIPRMLNVGAITTPKIAAGAVTADKLTVNSLSAVSATIGTLRTATTGARTEISDNLISVYDANNISRVRMGCW